MFILLMAIMVEKVFCVCGINRQLENQ